MARIEVLPQAVADRIAAGEVVERPASVVRELLDNALDAGARRIEIELAAGGRELISVADDGQGLGRDDALLAFERHATSKIRSGEDLERITTLGFRGEALAAIAAVSRAEMLTRTHDSDEATRVQIERGTLVKVETAARAPGTTVAIRDLFVGIPARQKFLKSPSTELDHALRAIYRAALARPEVGFRVRQAGKVLLAVPADQERGARIEGVLARRGARGLIPVEAEAGDYRVRAWAGRRDLHRHDREGVQLFLGVRPVRDPLLVRAVADVYRDILPPGRFPIVVLYLDIPPEEVDVNVHPAKSEVRFERPREIRAVVMRALEQAIARPEAIPHLGERALVVPGAGAAASTEEGGEWIELPPWPSLGSARPPAHLPPAPEQAPAAPERPLPFGPAETPGAQREIFSGGPRVLAQYRNTFILAEDAEGLLIVDQHVAHERILYEELSQGADAGALPRQALVFPRPLEVDPRHFDLLEEHRALVERLGFRVEPFGDAAFVVREVPAILGKQAKPDLLLSLLERLDAGDKAGAQDLFDHLIATVACHAAVKKGYPLSHEKMEYLLGGLDKCEVPSHCPHGRTISIRVDLSRLNRQFDRT